MLPCVGSSQGISRYVPTTHGLLLHEAFVTTAGGPPAYAYLACWHIISPEFRLLPACPNVLLYGPRTNYCGPGFSVS